jgi:hypothetical protein
MPDFRERNASMPGSNRGYASLAASPTLRGGSSYLSRNGQAVMSQTFNEQRLHKTRLRDTFVNPITGTVTKLNVQAQPNVFRALDPSNPLTSEVNFNSTTGRSRGAAGSNILRQALLPKFVDQSVKMGGGMRKPVSGVPYVNPYTMR